MTARPQPRGGLRQEGEAYLLRGDAKNDLGQDAAALADWRKAREAAEADPAAASQVDMELLQLKIDELGAAGPAE